MNIIHASIDNIIRLALAEDIGSGDITTNLLIQEKQMGEAYVVAKEDMALSGISVFKRVFQTMLSDGDFKFKDTFKDGEIVKSGSIIIEMRGRLRSLLTGERTALNFLQRMSGIATLTKKFVDKVDSASPHNVKIIDTRKTTPGLRILEKYAVRCGGGSNHRFGLYDGILIKDNHIKAAGGIANAIKKIRESSHHLMKIEVETKSIKEIKDALKWKADVIMLDNMDIPAIKKAVMLINKKAIVEVSGGVNLKNAAQLASTGVDYISIGALTHSAAAVDISMEIEGL